MTTSTAPFLTLVIPAYKESRRLPHFLPGLAETLRDVDCVIQVVDDGSPRDEAGATQALVEELRPRFPVILAPCLALPANRGKGGAIRAGWLAHKESQLLGFVDADGAIAPQEVYRVVRIAMASPDQAYFASRVRMLGRNVRRSFIRHLYGRVFATASSLSLKLPVYDTQCGLKIVPSKIFRKGAAPFEENGFAFDLELLAALIDQGFSVQEIPIDWTHIPGSKVNLIRDSVNMYLALNRVSRNRSKWTLPNKIK